MPRSKNPVPSYRRHKQSGQAIVTVRLPDGGRRDVLLGPYGSPGSKTEYERVLAELRATASPTPARPVAPAPTVGEVILAFWRHAEGHYRRPDGTPTNELKEYKSALRPLRTLYGHTTAAAFGPLALKAVRAEMVAAGWCRTRVNKQVGRLRRAFKWAAEHELVPFPTYHALTAVGGLQRGRTEAAERPPVEPVDDARVDAVLPHLQPTVRAMVELQRLTGMRPGEVRGLRAGDVEAGAGVWVYRPAEHKMVHADRPRVIHLGPRAQAVLRPFLAAAAAGEHVFSPARAREERFAAVRARRKTKVPPSQRNRRKPPGELLKRPPAAFTDHGYAGVVRRACKKAGVPPWHPNQLRHAHATAVRRAYGLEAAQVVLGHATADVTQGYAEADHALAARVALEVG